VAVLFALAAALCNALSTIFQRLGVETAPPDVSLSWKLVRHVLHRPVWFLGFMTMVGAFLFQASALDHGGLTVVQPLLVTELVFLVVILRIWFGHTLGWREAFGTIATVAGLGTFLAVSDQGGGNALPTPQEWLLVIIACAGAVVVAVLMTRVGNRPWRSAWFGASAAISFALCAAFIKATTTIYQRHGFVALFGHFEPYGIAAAGLAGLFLTQNAFHAGPITASQATLVIVDPIASIVIGVSLFDDNLRGGRGILAIDAACLALMSLGIFVLCHSPLIVETSGQDHLARRSRGADPHPEGAGASQ
jgi:drug/metabolite transporter (DMT)-like permease